MSESDNNGPAGGVGGKSAEAEEYAGWCVVRLDDNGNRFEIASGLSHAEAQSRVKEFEELGHKQTYWVVREG